MTKIRHFFIKINNYLIHFILSSILSFHLLILPSSSNFFLPFHFISSSTSTSTYLQTRAYECAREIQVAANKKLKIHQKRKAAMLQSLKSRRIQSNQILSNQTYFFFKTRPFQSYPIWHHQKCHIRYAQNLSQSKGSTESDFVVMKVQKPTQK